MMDIAAPAVPALGDKIDTASEASSPHDHDNEKELDVEESGDLSRVSSKMSFDQHIGVTKIESLYLVFGRGWKLYLLWLSIGLIGYIWSLATMATSMMAPFATSYWGKHTVVGTMGVIDNIMSAVALPFLSKICDEVSRPAGLAVGMTLFCTGYIIVAAAPNIYAVAAGQAVFTAGRTGIYQICHILICDMTQLRWRGLVIACYSLPWVVNGFCAGKIAVSLTVFSSGDGWRWGYGIFAIVIPVAIAPSISVMFWGDIRAKRLGALSIASSSYARRQVLAGMTEKKTAWQRTVDAVHAVDAVGLLLFGFALALLLTPATLEQLAKGGYKNPSLIAMYCVGGVLFIAFVVWDTRYARSPIFPRRLVNRTFLVCVFVDAFHFFSTGLLDAYYNSWVFIIKPQWSRTNYSYFSNIHNTGLCFFAVVAGCIMYLTKRYKTLQMVGLVIRLIGEGINFMTVNGNQNDATFIMARILISCGAGFIVTTTAVAAPASAPHTDLAGAMCVLHMFAQVAGSIAGSIAASVWNSSVPRNLKKYLPELTDKQRTTMFGSIGAAQRQLPHEAVNRAYTEAMRPLLAVAIATTGVALILSWWTVEIPLGRSHNIVETHKVVRVRGKFEVADEVVRKNADQAEAAALARVQRDQKQ